MVLQGFEIRIGAIGSRSLDPFQDVEDDAGEAVLVEVDFLVVRDLADVAVVAGQYMPLSAYARFLFSFGTWLLLVFSSGCRK